MGIYSNNSIIIDDEEHSVIKKAKVCEDVFYSVKITVRNKQYITQNIETENVTIKLKNNNNYHENNDSEQEIPRVIQCNNVEATVRLPCPSQNTGNQNCIQEMQDEDFSISQIRRLRKKRNAGVRFDDQ